MKRTAATALLALVASVLVPGSTVRAVPQSTTRYIVRFTDSTPGTDVEKNTKKNWDATSVSGAREFKRLSRVFNGAVATLTKSEVAALRKLPGVLWSEEDATVSVKGSTVTPPSWGLDRLDQRALPLDLQYSYPNDGSGVDVYVVDTGVLTDHAQFAGRIGTLPGDAFTSVADGNGTSDCSGHGTHVAGIAAGSTFGVAPAARVIPVRVLDCAGSGSVSGVVAGLEWVITHHTTRPAVVNMSFTTTKSTALESAVDRAYADGLTMVAAAGNANVDACTVSPAGAKVSALTVGATTTADARASYSNYGSCLDLFAPGSFITSAGIASQTATVVMSGTSMAAPHVAGLAARVLSSAPSTAPSDVMSLLLAESTQDAVSGAGALSPNRLAYASGGVVPPTPTTAPNTTTTTGPAPLGTGVPGAVTGLTVTAGASSADLSWTDAAEGDLPTTSHIVRVFSAGTLVDTVVVDNDSIHVIPGLVPGTRYSFRVASANGNGVGEFSASSPTVVPLRLTATYRAPAASTSDSVVPPRPTKVRAARTGRQLAIRWVPSTKVRTTGFEIRIYRSRKLVARVVTTANSGVRLSGLARGRYSVRVSARNTSGASALTSPVSFSF